MAEYVAFSGGIDSTALALVMQNATPVFTDTGFEFQELYDHLDKFEEITGREIIRIKGEETLPEYIKRAKFLPNHGARFCTVKFKIERMNKFLSDKLPATLNIALRADEENNNRVGNLTKLAGLTIKYPFLQMGIRRVDCVRKCMSFGLLPRYPVYMARGGCKGCFYKRRSEVQAMIALVPQVVDELQALEEIVQDNREKFFYMFPNVGCSIANLRSQPFLFSPDEVYKAAADKSDMGSNCGLFCNR